MNILVTGANGQLGNEMQRVAKTSSNHYIFTDVAQLDITDREAVLKAVKDNGIQVIVNCAAYTNVDKAEDDRETADLINNKAVENLAIAARENDATLIHISTDYVFKGDRCTPCREDWETDPLGVYGITKLAGEKSIERTGCRHIIIRTAWLRQELREDHAEAHRREGQPESGVRPGGHPHIRRRSGRRDYPHHRNRTARQARHLPLQQRRRLLVVRLRQGNLRIERQHLQHPALPQRRVPQQGETPPLLRPRQDQDQGHLRHRSTLLERLAEEVHQGAKN